MKKVLVFSVGLAVMILTASNALAVPDSTANGRSRNYDYGLGTSMSSPMVAATAALVWSTPYGTSNSSVRSRLQATADKIPGTGTYWSAGRANAANAVAP